MYEIIFKKTKAIYKDGFATRKDANDYFELDDLTNAEYSIRQQSTPDERRRERNISNNKFI